MGRGDRLGVLRVTFSDEGSSRLENGNQSNFFRFDNPEREDA